MALRWVTVLAPESLKRAAFQAIVAAALLALVVRFAFFNSSPSCDLCGADDGVTEDAQPASYAKFAGTPAPDSPVNDSAWLTRVSEAADPPPRTRFHVSNYGFPGPVPWRFVGQRVREEFTLGGRIAVSCWFHDKNKHGSEAKSFVWATDEIDALVAKARARDPSFGSYGPEPTAAFFQAFEKHAVEGKSVVVIGSRHPWVEAICLGFNAANVTTVDFNKPIASHAHMRQLLVDELEGSQEQFDIAVSFSSLEHDGLGRYGDPINPFGDLQRMQKIKGLLKPGGLLFLGVPVGNDTLVFNAHRVYGPIRMPLLLSGWSLLDVFGASSLEQLYLVQGSGPTQPVMVLAAAK